ncbi:MAG TPA: HD domain-containing phosphohydrolase [Lachnospiraceae bacterium]|nr:HD domain-containing phosphohydrolase [Lachnospiraceae bacterium]HPF30507.1 HD domain-containing phosphohydrolase [Lachnospiraceae bacterium]
MMIDVTKYHHECYNGSGYPSGLVGEEIPLSARIMAVVDVYDAIVNARCYKEAMSHEEAIAYLQEQAGEKFDPVIVYALVKIQRQILEGKDKSRGETL